MVFLDASSAKQNRFAGSYHFTSGDAVELRALQAELHKQAAAKKLPMASTIEDVYIVQTGLSPCLEVFTAADAQKPSHQAIIRKPLRKLRENKRRVRFLTSLLGLLAVSPFFYIGYIVSTPFVLVNRMLGNPAGKVKQFLGLNKTSLLDTQRYQRNHKNWLRPSDLETGLQRHGDKLFNPDVFDSYRFNSSGRWHTIYKFSSEHGKDSRQWPPAIKQAFEAALAENETDPVAYAIKQGLYKPVKPEA
jgi:hypothetical protein